MARKIAKFVIQYRFLILLLSVGVTLFCLYQLKNIELEHDERNIMPKDHPYVHLQEKMTHVFGGTNLVAIAMVVNEGEIFDEENLKKLWQIQKKIESMEEVVFWRVLSIVSRRLNRIYNTVDEDGYVFINVEGFDEMMERIFQGDKEYLKAYKLAIFNDNDIYGRVVSKDNKGTVILANFWQEKEYETIYNKLKKIIQEEEDENTRFYLAGRIVMLAHIKKFMRQMVYFFGVGVLLMVALLYIDFRSARGVFLPLGSAILTTIWALGILTALGYRLDVMSTVVPFLILALSHGHSVQMLSRYYNEFADRGDNKIACEEAVAGLLRPASVSVLTDSAGFASLILLPFPILKVMGLVAAIGILCILVTTFTLIPIILSYLPPPRRIERIEELGVIGRLMERVAISTTKGRRLGWVGAVAIILLITGVMGTRLVTVGELQPGSPDFWQDSEYNRAEQVLEKFTGSDVLWIYVAGPEGYYSLYDSQLTEDMNQLQKHLEERPDVGYTRSFVSFVAKINSALHESDPRWELTPVSNQEVAQYMNLLGGRGGQSAESVRDLYEQDFRQANIQVFVRDHKPDTIHSLVQDSQDFLKKNQKSSANIELAAGTIGIYAAIIEEIKKSQASNLILMYLFVLLFVGISFRSFTAALLVFVPLTLSIFITFGVMGFARIGLFLYTLPVAALGLGVGVDYSLYVLSRLREELGEGGPDLSECFIRGLSRVGKAVFFTGATVSAAMIVLFFSELRFQAMLALMMVIIMMANMLGGALLLPVMVWKVKPKFIFKKEVLP